MYSLAAIRPHVSPLSLTSSLVGVLFVCICAYVYFVAAAVLDAVVERDFMHQASTLQSEISVLESQQMTARHVISARIAEMSEVSTSQTPLFVSRSGDSVAFHKNFE